MRSLCKSMEKKHSIHSNGFVRRHQKKLRGVWIYLFSVPHVYLSLEIFLLSRTKQECAPMFTPVSEFSAHTSLASSHWGGEMQLLSNLHRIAPPVHAVIVVFCHVRTDFCKLKVCSHSTSKFYYVTYLGLFFVVELTSIGLITSLYLRVKKSFQGSSI